MLWKKIKWWQSSRPVEPAELPPPEKPGNLTELPDSRYFNRELSDLALIERVVEESQNTTHPILERVRFLAISASLLDQFYTVRVALMLRRLDRGESAADVDGLPTLAVLDHINAYSKKLMHSQENAWQQLYALLGREGMTLATPDALTAAEAEFARDYFNEHLKPVISPFIIDREHPFPYVPSGGLCIVAEGRNRYGRKKHMLVPLPTAIERFQVMPGDGVRVITLETIIMANLQTLFSDTHILGSGFFQILRDNDLAIGDIFEDLRDMVETSLVQRDRADVIRLNFIEDMPAEARFFVAEALRVLDKGQIELMRKRGLRIDHSAYVALHSLIGLGDALPLINNALAPNFPAHAFKHHQPRIPERLRLAEGDLFSVIRERDLLLHWPYDDFAILVDWILSAATDPAVTAIKQTLYRTSENSPVVAALIEAAAAGKTVVAVIELEARDDERSNVRLAKQLEAAGAHVVYGIIDLKVHCKMTMISRMEDERTVVYTHLGTGNYHPGNARSYTDLAYFTAREMISSDTNKIFNYLTSESMPECDSIVLAPSDLRQQLMRLIDAEIEHARSGRPAGIWAKVNSLTDPVLIEKLYEASCAGVNIELVVRRHCRLKPGVTGMSENIRVKSIVGRFLEHSRVYCFANGAALPHDNALVYIGSADWMERNFDDRVEVMVPMFDDTVRKQIIYDLLQRNLQDEAQSWQLAANGRYHRVRQDGFSAQDWYMEHPTRSGLRNAQT